MEAPSDTPPSSMDEKPPNQVSQGTQKTTGNHQDSEVVDTKQVSPTSVFVNSEPLREEQVQNAVKFLSHPKVSGSPVIYRRSFLERKGLTKEEIDEAFRRVPDPTPAVTTTQSLSANQGGQLNPAPNVPHQQSAQVLQATPVAPTGKRWLLTRPSQFHLSHALLALGYLAVSGVGTAMLFKKAIIPRLKSWIRKIVLEEEDGVLKKPSVAEENALAAKAAAAAASDVARAIHEMLSTKTEEKEYFGELISVVNLQVNELRSMSNAILRLESGIHARNAMAEGEGQRVSGTNSKVFPQSLQRNNNGNGYTDPRSVRSLPPNTNPRLTPTMKPLEYIPAQNSSTSILPTKVINNRGDSTEVPWYKRTVTNDEHKFKSSSNGNEERPAQQRLWVPPMPPPVSMPEAAVAIRQPKKPPSSQKEQTSDDQSLASDELQRITKISESGGDVEANDEIQMDDNTSSVEA